MANEIKYQLYAQLVDNTLTVDNTEDKLFVPLPNGTADMARIIAEMRAEDTGLRQETLEHVFKLHNRVVTKLLMSGVNVNTGLFYASTALRGVAEQGVWNPEKNSIVVNFQTGAELREGIKATQVVNIGPKGSTIYIGGVTDAATRMTDATATAGRAFTLTGGKLKVVGTDPSVGITLTSESGTVTRVTEDLMVVNEPSKVTFIIPANLQDGRYTLTLTTQYGGNSATMLKTPRSVEKVIYIGVAPETPGGGGTVTPPSGGGGDGEDGDNPIG